MPKLLREYDQDALRLANTTYNKILQFNLARQYDPPEAVPPVRFLYHYTSVDGLKGIIENNELWATSAYYLNDSAEVFYGCGVLSQVLDEWLAENPHPAHSLSHGLVTDLRQAFGDDFLNKTLIRPIYLVCFCEDDNLLSQWRAYGQSGGYSLGFNVKIGSRFQNEGFLPEPKVYTGKWVKVEYERSKQAAKCKSVLTSLLAIIDNPKLGDAIAAINGHPFNEYANFLKVFTEILFEEIVSFKNEAFKVENEWRIVVAQRELMKQGVDDGGKTPTPIYFRCSKGLLVPYVKLNALSLKKLPLASVRSGPTLDKMSALMAIDMILEKNGFPPLRVQGSDITVRF
jgi:hypothetical protein